MGTRFYQGDAKWGSDPYPNTTYDLARSGCGCCACATAITNLLGKKSYTPKKIRAWMVGQGFAVAGHGTTWDGITKTLQHYGFDKVVTPNISASMTGAWSELNKGNRAGVLLLSAGTKGGITWTSSGHYVAFDEYKVEGGKHYFLTRDSSGRNHTGWYCYEDTMRGLLPKIWIVQIPAYYQALQGMNIREEATTASDIVGRLSKGDIVAGTRVGKWLKMSKGYVCIEGKKKYIETYKVPK